MDIKELQKQAFRKLISNPKTLPGYLNKLSPDDFSNRLAREVISGLQQNGYSVHFAPTKEFFEVLLRDRLHGEELTASVEMLAKIAQNPQPQDDLDMLIKELKNERMCNELTRIMHGMIPHINPPNIEKAYESLMKQLLKLPLSCSDASTTGQLHEVFDDVQGRIDTYFKPITRKYPTGFKAFDDAIGGFAPGEMIVLMAGTGQGKSNVMLWWANQYLKAGANVAYITLEMSYEEVMDRYHGMITGLLINDIRAKRLTPQGIERYIEGIVANSLDPNHAPAFLRECATMIVNRQDPKFAVEISAKYPKKKNHFYVVDIPRGCSPARVDRELGRLSLDHKIDVMFVDYLNIMTPNFHSKDKVREQAEIAQDLKAVARKHETIIITGGQMNTADLKEDAKITTDAIRYSRAIGENSDWVLAFNRNADDYQMKQLRIDLAKHRYSAALTALLEVDFGNLQVRDLGNAEDNSVVSS